MPRSHKFLMVMTALAVMALATTGVVAADSTQDYSKAMRGFLPVIVDWTVDVQEAAHAAAVKPEPERLQELAYLGVRGEYILDDVRGTAALAPKPLQRAHWALADAIGTMATVAQTAENDPVAASQVVDEQMEWAEPALLKLQNHLTRFGVKRPGETPDMPGSGS